MKYLKNKKGSISLFVLLSLLFFLVLVTSVSTSRKNKEIIINQQYIRVKENYEREIGTEEQIYARKEKKFILEIDPNGGTYNNSTSTISISQKTGTQLQIENPTAPSIVFDVNGGVIGEVEESISFQNWILSGDGTLNGNIYTFGKSRATLTAKYNKNSIKLPTITKNGYTFNGWYDSNEEKAGNAGEYYSPKGAVTLKAKWTELNKNEVILAFKDSEGTQYGNPNPLILHEGETGTVRSPTIRNYGEWTSLYWSKGTDADSAKDVESEAEIENLDMNSSANYYARYEKEISVDFNLNGLEGETPIEQKGKAQVNASNLENIKGLEITIPTIANIEAHTINGWNTKEDGTGTSYSFGEKKEFKDNTTLYVQWTKNKYTVKFDANGGEGTIEDQQMTNGQAVALTENTFTRTGYTFKEWNTNVDGTGTAYTDGQEVNNLTTENNGQVTLYAQWQANKYDVVYKRNGLSKGYQEVEYIESTEGQYIDTGYFATDKTKIEVKYKMQLNNAAIFGARKMEGGNTSNNMINVYMLADASSLNDNIYYYYGKSYQQSTESIDPEKIYEATIENGKATISDMTDIQIATQDAFTMEYSMYLFAFNENNEVKFDRDGTRIYYFRIYENGNLQKYFVPCYRISDNAIGLYDIVNDVFYTNSGTGTFTKGNNVGTDGSVSIDGTMSNEHFVYDTAQNLTENIYTKQGYTFTGWNTKPDGTGTAYVDKQEVNNLTTENNGQVKLYAQWTGNSYTVKFDANGGEGTMDDQSFTYGIAQNLTANTYTRTGYTFAGWNTKADGSGISYTDKGSGTFVANETLYAQWTKNQYKVSFNPNRNILPSEYTEVGYIGTDGNQYINLDHTHPISTNTKVEIGAEFGESWIYGYTSGDTGRYGGSQRSFYTGSATTSWTLDTAYYDYVFDHSSGATIDGNTYSLNGTPSGSSGNNDIYLFRAKNSTVYVEGKIYYYKQYEGNTLVYDLVPCYRVSDNVSGMYDLVSNTFFTNAGIGSFTTGYRTQQFEYGAAQNLISNSITKTGYTFNGWNTAADGTGTAYTDGQEVNNLTAENNGTVNLYAQWNASQYSVKFNPNIGTLPSGYEQLEYIENDGNEYIDSGYKPSKNTGVEATFQFTDATTTQQRLFGVGSDTSVDDLFDYEFYINGVKRWGLALSNNKGTWNDSGINVDTKKHILSFNVKNDETYFISNTTQTVPKSPTGTRTMTSSNYNLYILGRNYYYNSRLVPGSYGKIKLYSFKIYEDGVIQKNFVPCYEISSGKAGLYDTIGNEFYPSAREGYELLRDGKTYSQDFTYGTAQNLSANTFTREGYEFVGWNTAADGTGTLYSNEQNVNNLVSTNEGVLNLYAIWNQNSYTVEYYPNRVGSEYREVEYIESTGSQYIDTGYYISGTTGVEAEYEYTSLTKQQRIFGTNYYQLYINGNGDYGYQFSNNTSDWKNNNIKVDKGRHKVEFNKNLGRLRFDNGNLYNNASILSGLTNTSPRTLLIMSGYGNNAKIKIYSFKIYENEKLVRNYIPCYKVSDNTIGMYETIKQEFHPSSASGMLKGEDVKTSQIITIGETQNLIANLYTNEYYTFNGWNTAQDGTGTSYTKEQAASLSNTPGNTIRLYAKWEEKFANIDGNGSTSKLEDVTELTNITRFEKYNGSNSNVQTLISNGTAVKIDDNTTECSIYAWYDNGTVYWWSDVNKVYLLDKSHYLWSQLTNAEYINVTGVDTSKVTNMNGMFRSTGYDASTFQIVGLDTFNTSNVKSMAVVFEYTGYNATSFDIGDIGSWDTSNVTTMQYLFSNTGRNATTWYIGDLSNWNVSKVTSFTGTFYYAGYTATTFNIGNLSNWRFNMTNNIVMGSMFTHAGRNATTWYIGDISDWNVEKVTSFNGTFNGAGYNATTFNIGNLSNWRFNTASNITMQNMFNNAGKNSTTWYIGDISNWNVEKVTNFNNTFANAGYTAATVNIGDLSGWRFNTTTNINMQSMFAYLGYNATVFDLGDLDSWNVEKVTTFNSMFSNTGRNSQSWNIGDLSGWKTGNANSMAGMFASAGYTATTVSIGDLSGWNTENVTAMNTMFSTFAYSANTFNIGDIGSWNVSKVTSFNGMFTSAGRNATTWYIGDLSNWTINTVNDVTMQSMFAYAGYSSTNFNIGNIGSWNVSKVTTFNSMFSYAGYDSVTWNIGDLSSWDVSKVTDFKAIFQYAGYTATTVSIGDLSAWNTGNVTDMSSMFSNFAYSANSFNIGNIGSWNVSKVKSFNTMFAGAGRLSTTWNIGDLSNWVLNTTDDINMASMFNLAAYSASNFDIGNIGLWNVSKVTTMQLMFNNAGRNATTWNIGDLSNWDVSSVTNMYYLFNSVAYSATTFNIGNLSNWNTSNVTNMACMFNYAGANATTWNSIGTLKVYASNIENLLRSCANAKGTINIYSNPTAYTGAFAYTSTVSGSGIVVNYSSSTTNIDNIIATKTPSSNVTKGSQLD